MSGTGGFQTQVYQQPVMAIAGDFASANPYFTFDAGPGGLVSGSPGVTIGLFAWVYPPDDPNGAGKVVQNFGSQSPDGFVHRAQQGTITQFLAFAGAVIVPGQQMSLMNGGDFWVVNAGSAAAQSRMKAFANLQTGIDIELLIKYLLPPD